MAFRRESKTNMAATSNGTDSTLSPSTEPSLLRVGTWAHSFSSAPQHDLYLDWLRGLAAVAVFLGHVRGEFFVKWADLSPGSQNPVNFILFVLTSLGREAVIVFFVLSGYLVGGNAIASAISGRFNLQKYFIARIARLYPVIVPAMMLTSLFDYLRSAWTQESDGAMPFVINLFFLQGILGPCYGSNAPFWSLAYEWWFYTTFGMCVYLVAKFKTLSPVALAIAVVALLTFIYVMAGPMILTFPLWLLGVAARGAPMHRSKWITVMSVLLFGSALAIDRSRGDQLGDYVVGAATFILICCIKNRPPIRRKWFSFGAALASFSFTLYAVHYPLNALVQSLLVQERIRVAGVSQWFGLSILAGGMALVCYWSYLLFERKSPEVRRWLEGLLRSNARTSQ